MTHLHPRHLRASTGAWSPRTARPLHAPLRPVQHGASKARKWFTYKGAADNLLRGRPFSLKLKADRLELGISRREYDKHRKANA